MFGVVSILGCGNGWAASEYETVVRESSFASSSRVVITGNDIEKSKATNLTSVLKVMANINISSTSFQPNGFFIRGGDSGHVLIVVDGIPFYDASSAQRTVNLDNMDVHKIKRIEVLKGSQSVLYGGQALSGVIIIDTLPGEIKDQARGALELGRFEYRKASLAGAKKVQDSSVVVGHAFATDKNLLSPVKSSDIRYQQAKNSLDLAWIQKGEFDFFAKTFLIHQRAESPTANRTTYEAADTKDYVQTDDIAGAQVGLQNLSANWRPQMWAGYQQGRRSYEQPINSYANTATNELYKSQLTQARIEIRPVENNDWKSQVGFSYLKEDFGYDKFGIEQSKAFGEQRGIFVKADSPVDQILRWEIGGRSEFIDARDREDAYQLGLTFLRQVKLEYSTGIKMPSLFQLYSSYGNPQLSLEKSRSMSLTYTNEVSQEGTFSATIFETHFDNLVVYDTGTLKYQNLSRAMSRGIEGQYGIPVSDWSLSLGASYEEPRDVSNARWLLRRPLQTASLRAEKKWNQEMFQTDLQWIGSRWDQTGANTTQQLAPVLTVNGSFSHNFSEQWQAYVRAQNIFDQRYQQSTGYYDEGLFALVGLQYQE